MERLIYVFLDAYHALVLILVKFALLDLLYIAIIHHAKDVEKCVEIATHLILFNAYNALTALI
jgi:hypothetical protein